MVTIEMRQVLVAYNGILAIVERFNFTVTTYSLLCLRH